MVFEETTGVYERFQMNRKERVISEFEIEFKKSCLSSGLNSTYTRSENVYGFKRPEAGSENAGCGK